MSLPATGVCAAKSGESALLYFKQTICESRPLHSGFFERNSCPRATQRLAQGQSTYTLTPNALLCASSLLLLLLSPLLNAPTLVCEGIQRNCRSYCLPVSPKYSLGFEQHISTHRAGLQSNRIALLRAKQLQDHLGFSIMSPTSPVSPTSPLRGLVHTEAGLDPHSVAQMQSPQGVKDWEVCVARGVASQSSRWRGRRRR